ncbi:hypothetical protein B0A50_02807 [Salinomyces thailandicus]|uniref:Uncharacterized protein n=1 Tax=Salinomyces thailandicus TaxID=706561 RepID=A0A4U0U524_9PEZI|nr:hypothetical protein B0A50_02807 [Salinomyces thailandica]
MASTLGTHPYDYQKASTTATRALVSDIKPAQVPSSSSGTTASNPNNNNRNVGEEGKHVTTGPATSNYQDAASAATAANAAAAAAAAKRDAGAGVTPSGAGGVQRQQSWKQSDLKREAHEKLLDSSSSTRGALQGYHSAAGGQ